jgi:hypothetical protein
MTAFLMRRAYQQLILRQPFAAGPVAYYYSIVAVLFSWMFAAQRLLLARQFFSAESEQLSVELLQCFAFLPQHSVVARNDGLKSRIFGVYDGQLNSHG